MPHARHKADAMVDPGAEFAAAVTTLGERRDRDREALSRVSVLPVGGSLEVAGRL